MIPSIKSISVRAWRLYNSGKLLCMLKRAYNIFTTLFNSIVLTRNLLFLSVRTKTLSIDVNYSTNLNNTFTTHNLRFYFIHFSCNHFFTYSNENQWFSFAWNCNHSINRTPLSHKRFGMSFVIVGWRETKLKFIQPTTVVINFKNHVKGNLRFFFHKM